MKVLFAVSNETISDSIVKKYQKDYKEIISYKNVYYFNAIQKEIQRDKTYDRIIISEDLEPFANNDYEAIDRFLFEKLDNISDEATDNNGEDTPIILICSDRRTKSEQLLVKLFGIGIYNALLGQDRSIEEVCKLIRKPRTKKEAKIYYKIESEDVNYQAEAEDTVSEAEIQNIRAHYRKLGKNEEAYVESFDNIASQYTDAQLKIIVKFLPLSVRAVLERDSSKYQQVMAFAGNTTSVKITKTPTKKEDALRIDFIENQLNKSKPTKPVIVPSAVGAKEVKKITTKPVGKVESKSEPMQETTRKMGSRQEPTQEEKVAGKMESRHELMQEENATKNAETLASSANSAVDERSQTPVSQVNMFELDESEEKAPVVEPVKRGRGRPRKVLTEEEKLKAQMPKRGRGRPRKNPLPEENQNVNLFDLDEEKAPVTTAQENILPGMEDFEEIPKTEEPATLPGFEEEVSKEKPNASYHASENVAYPNGIIKQSAPSINIESLLTKEKKIVSFVGTTKNGTSFLVNNLAELFSSMGINTAILDMTKNKNAYFIYTKNEEELRRIATNCMENLENDVASGIKVNNNLTVYTSLPSGEEYENKEAILATLVKNHSLVLIDCDFHTPVEYFEKSQEIYLVQSMDILTIQPLTAFLRDIKAKNVLEQEKLKIIVNKYTKVRGLNSKIVIGGMAFYNDPSMSFMTELFNKDAVKYINIPYNDKVYAKYIEGLVNCKITLNGYDKNFMIALKDLGNMVYPLLNNKYKPVEDYSKKAKFSAGTENE